MDIQNRLTSSVHGLGFVRFRWRSVFNRLADISNGRGDDVRTTGPLAQVDQAAALAAEREVGIFAAHPLLAGGAR